MDGDDCGEIGKRLFTRVLAASRWFHNAMVGLG